MLIQIHMLQNYAPSNLNRDDSGSPKSAVFGNVRRGRISSQSLKRSIRQSDTFDAEFAADGLLASRTKTLPTMIKPHLLALGASEEDAAAIGLRLPELGGGKKYDPKKDDRVETRLLIFLNDAEAKSVAQSLWKLYEEQGAKNWADPKKTPIATIEKAIENDAAMPRSVDVAMFGRMTTSAAFEDMHAAVQVAHALSTHAVEEEFDYFTAVDDLTQSTGAGMIGDMEFNSSTYYKYFNIQWEKLLENLGGDVDVAKQAVGALIEAAATAHPSGKQNSTAALNLPDFVLVDVKQRNLPVSLANAFLKPQRADYQQTLIEKSVSALTDYNSKLQTTFNLDGQQAYISTNEVTLETAQNAGSLVGLKQWAIAQIGEVANG